MDPRKNPYAPGAGTPPPALVGREALLDACTIAVDRIKNRLPAKGQMITGLRGVGKTVLLNRFFRIAERHGLESVLIEAPEDGEFLKTLAKELRRTLLKLESRGAVTDAIKRAIGALMNFSVTAGVDQTGSLEFGIKPTGELGIADSGDTEIDLRDLFSALGEVAEEHGTAIFIAIDELQYLSRKELGALIGSAHRTTQRELPVLIMGAGLPNLPALAGEAKTYAERLFDFHEIGSLKKDDIFAAISKPANELGVEITDDALTEIVRVTEGYPYFVQEWAHDTWDAGTTSPLSVDDVYRASDTVTERLDRSFFRVRFDRLTPKEQQYLRAMAELGPGPHGSGDIASVYGMSVNSAARVRDVLIEKGMLYSPGHGKTAFTVPLFDRFLKRAVPELHAHYAPTLPKPGRVR